MQKDRAYYDVGFGSATGLMPDGIVHRHRRNHMIKSLSVRLTVDLDKVICMKVAQLATRIRVHAASRQLLNLSDAYRSLGHDIMSALFFGQADNCLASPDFAHDMHQMSRGLFRFLDIVRQFPFLPSVLNVFPDSIARELVPSLRYTTVRRCS